MTDGKGVGNVEPVTGRTSDSNVDELARIVSIHLNPTTPTSPGASSTTGSTRTYTPPLMGTSARAAKRRADNDSGPVRIEGTDTYNQQLQHHYQNVRKILEDQEQQPENSNTDTPFTSEQSFSAKRDFFEQRFKDPSPTYDAPPRQQPTQKVITTITTTTSAAPSVHDRTSSSSNESPSVDRVLEEAVELQKMSSINSTKNTSQTPLIIERTEQYQVFLDSSNHEVRRTPSISRTSIVPVFKTGHATDLDQAQAQAELASDDHQAIQNLTRALQEHSVTTINEYKRLPSQVNTTSSPLPSPSSPSSRSPPEVLADRTNLPTASEFTVIDALLNNPLGTIDEKYNNLSNLRYNDIITNLRNPEYLNSFKQPTKTSKETKKKPKEKEPKQEKQPKKEKKPKEKKSKDKKTKDKPASTTDSVEHTSVTPLVDTLKSEPVQPITTISSEQTPLIDPKEKKKQEKENKKQIKTKSKTSGDYQVVDALLSSPVSLRLPDSYLAKYNVSAPLSQSSPLQSLSSPVTSPTVVATTTSKDNKASESDKYPTLSHLGKIVSELQLHHAAALTAAATITPSQPKTTAVTSKETFTTTNRSIPVVNEAVHQQPFLEQQRPKITSNQVETRPQSETIKPRIIYRYIDEQGRLLKISSTPPSQLREQPAQQYTYRNTEPPYLYGRHIAIDDERRHPLPQYEQRVTWQGEPKLPTTVTREDFESRDKRVPHITEQTVPHTRTIPVSVEHERPSRVSSQPTQPRAYHYPNQQNVKLAWLPLSYQPEQQYIPSNIAGYDTDSTTSERSAIYRQQDYGPTDSHHCYSNRPLHHDYHYNRSPGPSYYPPAHYANRGVSPDYGGVSRNYIEVFRGGDFRESKPSEVYSLPLSEHIRTSPNSPANNRHSRYDQYQTERYGTISNRDNIPSLHQNYYYSNTLPNSRYQQSIPSPTVHYTHRTPYYHRTVQDSPNPEYANYLRQSKSFDYRPLRTKLQREYKITPNLLVDEWEYPQKSENIKYSTTTTATNRSGVSSPDDVFITDRTNKA